MYNLVKVLKALSDETRIRILNVLLERECCVCEIMQALDISQTRASRNLNILYDAGLLSLTKVGAWSLYSINKEELKEYSAYLVQGVTKFLEGNPTVKLDRERLARAERVGPGCAERARSSRTHT